MGIGVSGCDNKEEKKISDFEPSYIAFKDIDVQEVQQLVQGKWRVTASVGGVAGWQNVTGVFLEYIGTDKFREIVNNSISEKKIVDWERTEYGCKVTFEKDEYSKYRFLESLTSNDTLSLGDGNIDGLGAVAVRIK
jgi:hypothetical protein